MSTFVLYWREGQGAFYDFLEMLTLFEGDSRISSLVCMHGGVGLKLESAGPLV